VATVAVAVQHRDAVPGQALAARQQEGLIGLDDQQVVGVLLAHQELGGLGVGLECVGCDHHPGQVQGCQQRGEGGHLLGRAIDLALGRHGAGGVVDRGQQVDLAAVASGASQRLPSTAIARRHCRFCWGRSRSQSQAPIAVARACGSRQPRVRRMVVSVGTL
jgi:hypothetical protein